MLKVSDVSNIVGCSDDRFFESFTLSVFKFASAVGAEEDSLCGGSAVSKIIQKDQARRDRLPSQYTIKKPQMGPLLQKF